MGIFALPARRITNPAFYPSLNRAHPLLLGMTDFFLTRTPLTQTNMVSGSSEIVAGSATRPSPQATSYGIGLRGSASTTRWVDARVRANSGAAKITYIVGLIPSSLTSAGIEERIWDNGLADNTTPKMTRNKSGSTINQMDFYAGRATSGGVFEITLTGQTIGAVQYHCITTDYSSADSNADLSNGTMQWYVNGIAQSVTVITNGSGDTTEPPYARLLGINAASRGYEGVMLFFGKYNRILTPTECKSITTNPWQIFQATDRLYLNSVAGAATFNSYWSRGSNVVHTTGAKVT